MLSRPPVDVGHPGPVAAFPLRNLGLSVARGFADDQNLGVPGAVSPGDALPRVDEVWAPLAGFGEDELVVGIGKRRHGER